MINDSYKTLVQEYDVISFDLFDTLILRKCLFPTDAFNLIKRLPFKHSRVQLERKAREVWKLRGKDEINFDDLYGILPNSDFLKNKELEVERDLIYINEPVREILEYAKSIGKTIILASDMYMKKDFLEGILKENNIVYDEFYLSSELNATKHTGKLYELIKGDYKDKKILHIDDRKDLCVKAESYGFSTLHVPLLRERDKVKYLQDKHGNNDCSIYSAVVSQNRNEDFWYNIGYDYIGITSLALINLALKDTNNYDKLLFLSRDAYLPYIAYKNNFKDNKAVYFKTNRWLQRCYSIKPETTLESREFQDLKGYLGGLNVHNTNALAKYLKVENKLENTLLKHTWVSSNSLEKSDNLNEFLEANFEEVKQRCLSIKENYDKYLKKFKNKKVAIVDLGWNGSCLEFFKEAGIEVVNGYFFGYLQNDNRIKSLYIQDKNKGNLWEYFSINVIENLFSSNEGTLIDINNRVFIEEVNEYELEFHDKRDQIFKGALKFIEDFINIQQKYKVEISNELITDIFNRLFDNPTLEEAEQLGSIIHYNGTEPTYVAKPSELAILNKSILDIEMRNTTWHQGYNKILKEKYNISIDNTQGRSYNDYISKVNEFVKDNKGKKIICVGAGSFAEHLLNNTTFKELDIIFLDNFRTKGLCGKIVLNLQIFLASSINYDKCIWTMIQTSPELEEQYKELKPIKIF